MPAARRAGRGPWPVRRAGHRGGGPPPSRGRGRTRHRRRHRPLRAGVIDAPDRQPVVVGHSFGGLIAQKLLGQGPARAAVALGPARIKGVKALPFSQLRPGFPVLGNPANRRRSAPLTAAQFRCGFGNAVCREESDELFERHTIRSPGGRLCKAALANVSRNSPAAVGTGAADRGPLLLVSGQEDHAVPDAVTRAAHKPYGDSPAVPG
ncbi:alpha/beta fold hydrolase [Streptomyces sp. NPDC001380]|uniref:alpha/beta fold hydrolase n=1 Tax=Streptomyces sp. NPDC001380 TaxID=3364566 RepID=UPI0036A0E86C